MRLQIGFWLLGLCNNFGYVIMLAAAMDILNPSHHSSELSKRDVLVSNGTDHNSRDCNPMSTGTVLLADVLPTIFIKLISPFIAAGIHIRVIAVVASTAASFIIVALSKSTAYTFFGIVCASLAAGLGEATFLASSSRFTQETIPSWSSGTGGAGILGALTYASLTGWGLTPRQTLISMLVIPVLMAISFWILVFPLMNSENDSSTSTRSIESIHLFDNEQEPTSEDDVEDLRFDIPLPNQRYDLRTKLSLIPGLFRYMLPLGFIYFFEYLINQGLFELLYFPDLTLLNHSEQYRWLQVDYQVGVFLSRSSHTFFSIDKVWILTLLQTINFVILLPQAMYWFMPSFWIVFVFVFWEGLLGGAAYVNTFSNMRKNIESREHREFALGFGSLADSIGIALAGVTSIPLHSYICSTPAPTRGVMS